MSGEVTITLPRDLATALLERAREEAAFQSYGYFAGGDPRDFVCDPECSTDDDRAAHASACEAWNRGDAVVCPPSESTTIEGGTITHTTRAGYGLGTQTYRDPLWAALAGRLAEALAVKGGAQ